MKEIKYTIYTYGGGEQLDLAFNAIAALFKDNAYECAFYIAALMFGFWVLITSVIQSQPLMPIKWMFWFWIATTIMLAPKVDLMIYDPITKYERKVDNVPYVLGAFASIVSGIGRGITDTVETFFKLPDYQKYGENGPVFASKILKNMHKYRIRDGTLKENMERFIDQCVVLEALMGAKYTVKELRENTDIWKLVSENANPINGFSYRDKSTKSSDILTCKEGAAKLEKDLATETKSIASYFGQLYNSKDTRKTSAAFTNFFKEKLKDSYNFMSDMAVTAEDILKQEMMINAIEDVQINYAVSKVAVQQRISSFVTGELVSNILVSTKIVLETIAYCGFIFIAIIAMLPGGIATIGKYFGILMWLQLWAPLYAILNMVMSSVARYQSKAILANGLNMMTSVGLSGLHADIEAVAAMCSASIPFISYALLQGGMSSFMGLAGTLTGSMSSAAQGVSGEVASGNLSMANVSYGGRQQMMISGFKHDSTLNYRGGRIEMETMGGAQAFMTPSGFLGTIAGDSVNTSRLADKITLNKVISSGLNSSIATERSIADSYSKNYEKSKAMSIQHSKELLQAMTKSIGQSQNWQISQGSRHAESINKTAQFTKSLNDTKTYTAEQSAEITASLGGKILGFGVGSSFKSKAAYTKAVQHGKSLAESMGVSKHLEIGVSHLNEVRFNEGSGEEKKIADNLQVSLNEMERASSQASLHNATADKLQQYKQIAENLGIGINEDMTERFIDFMANHKTADGSGTFGREKAIQIASSNKIGAREELLKEFAGKIAAEEISRFTATDTTKQIGKNHIASFEAIKEHKQNAFHNKIIDDANNTYGNFNKERAEKEVGRSTDNAGSKYFNDTSNSMIMNNEVAKQNKLSINSDLGSKKTKDKYQIYTPQGSNTPINIVEEVKTKQSEIKPKIEQQEAFVTQDVKKMAPYVFGSKKMEKKEDGGFVSLDLNIEPSPKTQQGHVDDKLKTNSIIKAEQTTPEIQENSGPTVAPNTSPNNQKTADSNGSVVSLDDSKIGKHSLRTKDRHDLKAPNLVDFGKKFSTNSKKLPPNPSKQAHNKELVERTHKGKEENTFKKEAV